MLSNQSYVDSKYNDIKNNQMIFFTKVITVDISHYFSGDGQDYIQNLTILENGYIPYIYTVPQFVWNGTITLQQNGSFEIDSYKVIFDTLAGLDVVLSIKPTLNSPVVLSGVVYGDLIYVSTSNMGDRRATSGDTLQNIQIGLGDITTSNAPQLKSSLNMRGSGSSKPIGTASGIVSIKISGIGIKPI